MNFIIALFLIQLILIHNSDPLPRIGNNPVVVIELFTSQGCSSCPPAERLFEETLTRAKNNHQKIYGLAFHVDYWDRLGWKDPFSDKTWSERQRMYGEAMRLSSIYTPQMIVNGAQEFTGSNRSALNRSLEKATHQPAEYHFRKLSAERDGNGNISATFETDPLAAGHLINFALVSLQNTTSVKRGENSGRSLREVNIVRQMIQTNAPDNNGIIRFSSPENESISNLMVVAFIQNKKTLSINGAAETKIF